MIQKFTTHLFRFLVGAVFIFSGFVKLVDPIGSQYKFEEYFSENVLNIEFLIPYALPFSILLIIAEIMLGVLLIIGYKSKCTIVSLFGITTVFLFLTWYSAYYNKVNDCGCFGDAIKLTSWETFYKNIIIIAMIAFLWFQKAHIKPFLSEKLTKGITYISLFGFLYITYHVLTHLPIIDFRPYAIGKNINEGMEYKNDGQIPPVHDFSLETADDDLTQELLSKEKVMLVLMYDLDKSDLKGFESIKKSAEKALTNGYTVYGVSASFEDDLILAQNKYNLPFSFLFCDATTLKTMMRANPGVLLLDKGTVVGKWNWIDVDEIEF